MSWHLASISSSGSSPFARTATHSSMGSSVDARWSARFGAALSVRATCARGRLLQAVHADVASTADAMSAVHDAPSREDRRVVPDGVDATIGAPRGCVWKGVLPENPGRSHQNLLNCALRFTSPCAVTSKPLLCCSESAAAAL